MIRFIAAIDSQRGLTVGDGIIWDLPSDKAYFRDKTTGGTLLMGYGEYLQQPQPLPGRRNLVATHKSEALRPGFEKVTDARKFLQAAEQDVWVDGGAQLFANTLDLADELYLTVIDHDFGCTKFFPGYEDQFKMVSASEPVTENGLTYKFTVWRRK